MAFFPEGYGQVIQFWGGTGLPRGAATTWGIRNDAEMEPADVAGTFAVNWNSNTPPAYPNTITQTDVLARLGPSSAPYTGVITNTRTGTSSTDGVSPNTSMLVRRFTLMGGRRGRGRVFLPILGENTLGNGGTIVPATVASWQTGLNDFMAAMNTIGLPLCLIHSEDLTPSPITSLSVEATAATQRRRLRR